MFYLNTQAEHGSLTSVFGQSELVIALEGQVNVPASTCDGVSLSSGKEWSRGSWQNAILPHYTLPV